LWTEIRTVAVAFADASENHRKLGLVVSQLHSGLLDSTALREEMLAMSKTSHALGSGATAGVSAAKGIAATVAPSTAASAALPAVAEARPVAALGAPGGESGSGANASRQSFGGDATKAVKGTGKPEAGKRSAPTAAALPSKDSTAGREPKAKRRKAQVQPSLASKLVERPASSGPATSTASNAKEGHGQT
jgi:hypothetical protein